MTFLVRIPVVVGVLLALGSCARPIATAAACATSTDCDPGLVCAAGACGEPTERLCTTDLECDPSKGEVCQSGVCVQGNAQANGGGDACLATSECPTTQFCDTSIGTCVPLEPGWCREDVQCTGTTPLCSNRAQGIGSPGRCVACVDDTDCSNGATCIAGACEAPTPGTSCGTNAVVGTDGSCRCKDGFSQDASGTCVVDVVPGGEGEGEGEGDPPGGEGEGEGEGDPGVPAAWNCAPSYFNGNDGCDCGCGAVDPDCDDGGVCDFCYDADGAFTPCPTGEGEGEGEGDTGADSCAGAFDFVCDEDNGLCAPGSDTTDCAGPNSCRFAFDGLCDEPDLCRAGSDTADCTAENTCEFILFGYSAYDGFCDDPCTFGVDTADCLGGGEGNSCLFSYDRVCDEPTVCDPGTDTTDCGG
jgi:hypothetical protein